MPNVFDQFDGPAASFAEPNIFDQIDPPKQEQSPGFFGSIKQLVQGKHDPRYKDLPALQDALLAEKATDVTRPMALSALMNSSDAQLGDIAKKSLGDRYLGADKDANGYDVIHYKSKDGTAKSAYLNKPGLDVNDLGRAATGALPFIGTGLGVGALAGKLGLGLGGSMIAQGLGAGGTSVLGDVAQQPLGSDQGIEPGKAALMTGLGAAGEPVAAAGSALWRRFITEPKYFDKTAGQLTPLGEQAARQLGLDPAAMNPDASRVFARTYTKNPAQTDRAIGAVTDKEFDIPSTVGQRTKDPEQLMQEKGMRSGLYGPQPKDIITGLDQQQKDAVERAIHITVPSKLTGQQTRAVPPVTDLGQSISGGFKSMRNAAKAAESAAWPKGDITPTMDAAPLLGDALRDNLGEYAQVFSPEGTPIAYRMGRLLNDYVSGKAPSNELQKAFKLSPANGVDAMRKSIGMMMKDAQTPVDKAAARAIYHGFDDWTEKAAQQGFLSGNMADVAAFRGARDVSKEVKSILAPRVGNQLSPGGKLLEQIKASGDTPERIGYLLFTNPQSKTDIKAGSIEALTKLKQGLTKYSDPAQARATWNDIRLMHWSKMAIGGNGEVLSAQVLKENLKSSLNKQSSLMKTLYSPDELGQLRRLVVQLEKITYKDPNPSGTATGVAVFAKQFVGRILDAFGPFGRAAFEYSGIPRAYGTAIAKRAVAQEAAKAGPAPGLGFVAPAIGQGPYRGTQ